MHILSHLNISSLMFYKTRTSSKIDFTMIFSEKWVAKSQILWKSKCAHNINRSGLHDSYHSLPWEWIRGILGTRSSLKFSNFPIFPFVLVVCRSFCFMTFRSFLNSQTPPQKQYKMAESNNTAGKAYNLLLWERRWISKHYPSNRNGKCRRIYLKHWCWEQLLWEIFFWHQ